MHECMDSSGWPALPSVVGQSLSARAQGVARPLSALRPDAACRPCWPRHRRGGFGCSQEGYYPTSARCTPSFIGACPCHVVVTHGALPSYRYPSRELVAHQRAVVTESYHPRGVAV